MLRKRWQKKIIAYNTQQSALTNKDKLNRDGETIQIKRRGKEKTQRGCNKVVLQSGQYITSVETKL